MTALVIAEHNNAGLKGSTHNTVTAAAQLGVEVHVLVADYGIVGDLFEVVPKLVAELSA